MKLNIKDVQNGDTIAIFTTWDEAESNVFLLEHVTIEKAHKGLYEIMDSNGYMYLFDEDLDTVFSTLEEAIDNIRYIDYINNFNETTFNYYLPYLKEYIDKGKHLYGIRRDKINFRDKNIIKYRVMGIKYDCHNYGKWKIRLMTEGNPYNIPYAILYFNAENLGKTLFFSIENAKKKVNK